MTELEAIYEEFSTILGKEINPTAIVHCKAGVGRTGFFILYHILKNTECITKEVSFDKLAFLRSCRPHMVYTANQALHLYKNFLKKLKINSK